MIYLLMLLLALLSMLPLFFSFLKTGIPRSRRDTALVLHRAQLDELARDLEDCRIDAGEFAGARLEIERRLLSADTISEQRADGNARFLLAATAILIPLMAFLLYLPGSTPNIPSEPHAQWIARQQAAHAQAQILIAELRAKLSTLDPNCAAASEGEAFLAEALAEDAGELSPESIALFKQSLRNAPPGASWRVLDAQRLGQAGVALQ